MSLVFHISEDGSEVFKVKLQRFKVKRIRSYHRCSISNIGALVWFPVHNFGCLCSRKGNFEVLFFHVRNLGNPNIVESDLF